MPERKWLKIGEAAATLGVSPKELRYWESVIPEIKPRRSKGNLRYYHVDELPRLRSIRGWLREGLTVADCRDLLARGATGTIETVPVVSPPTQPLPAFPSGDTAEIQQALRALLAKLNGPPAPSQRASKPRQPKPLPPPPGTPPLLMDD